MKKILLVLAVLAATAGFVRTPVSVKPGEVLPPWQKGWLDIHSVNGGRGESFYYIFPDGTTMLVDAGGSLPEEDYPLTPPGLPSKPSKEITTGQLVTDYIRHFEPASSKETIDYMMVSHFHGDHFGLLFPADDAAGARIHPEGGFQLVSVAEVGSDLKVGKIIDRGDFTSRASKGFRNKESWARYENYRKFVSWSERTNGTVYEPMQVGRDDQIVLKHTPAKFHNFSVRNLAAGGNYWTGEGYGVDSTYIPSPAECLDFAESKDKNAPNINENIFSCVFLLQYGKFKYFAGGDLQYKHKEKFAWLDAEAPVARVVPEVDVMKLCHHGTSGANSQELMDALKPNVAIACNWRDVQPNPATLKRVYKANPDTKVITTNMVPRSRELLLAGDVDPDRFLSTQGHVVIRVAPRGKRYWVLILEDDDQSYLVKDVFGPYRSK
ncbi:MAG: MBL fold metallo-hydrolase [Bacteroidales bacterium]|nr:MBL fold metallo-hydrolase [Bacteroidales bacterium]